MMFGIAGLGHIAVALASARLRGGEDRHPAAWSKVAAYVALAMLPDADVLPSLVMALKGDLSSHRGLTHTPLFALSVGIVVGLVAWWGSPPGPARRPVRDAVIAALLVGSHGVLDAMAQGGRGILFLWPISLARFHCVWRPIPDIPVGLALATSAGVRQLGIELLLFLPLMVYALAWRRSWRSDRGGRSAPARAFRPRPVSSVVEVRRAAQP